MSTAIDISNLSKMYRVGHNTSAGNRKYRTFRDDLQKWVSAPFHAAKRLATNSRLRSNREVEDFFALDDVSFEIKQGEAVGIIGRNGAGKSTLLKILSRIMPPTSGRATIQGRVGSLLEVGTGFHPELTGRENVYMNGSILGMSRREIDRSFDEIVDFSGVERFLDTPVKRYSSGMQVRLAFAVAAHLEPEVLIVDEVLAVGDIEFQNRCLRRMESQLGSGRTVLFVSHNMAAVQSLCSRAILLNRGKVAFDGASRDCIDAMVSLLDATKLQPAHPSSCRLGGCSIDHISIVDQNGSTVSAAQFGSPLCLRLHVTMRESQQSVHALITFWRRKDLLRVGSITTRELPCGPLTPGTTQLEFQIDPNTLLPGEYYCSVSIQGLTEGILEIEGACSFDIEERILAGASHAYKGSHGVVHLCDHFTKTVVDLPANAGLPN